MKYLVLNEKKWNSKVVSQLNKKNIGTFYEISKPELLTLSYLSSLNPIIIFVLHWSHILPNEIYSNYHSIGFHMTDLPFGRGGSPLQNLIVNGIKETKISAFRITEQLDAGPIYLKKEMSLYGTAEEIFIRASEIALQMIETIIKENPKPFDQKGDITEFKRRKPSEGNICELDSLNRVFDHIRMLDADGYPQAFLETKNFHIEFSRASLKTNHIIADAKIVIKKEEK